VKVRVIVKREIPMRPPIEECHGYPLRDELWSLMIKCWSFEASNRPRMMTVVEQIRTLEARAARDTNTFSLPLEVPASNPVSPDVSRHHDMAWLDRVDALLHLHESHVSPGFIPIWLLLAHF
jgi:hypothetical protein